MCKVTHVATRTHTIHISVHMQNLLPLQRAIDRAVWQLAPPCSVLDLMYVSNPVFVQGQFLLHRSVFFRLYRAVK